MLQTQNSRHGFTLVELLVVIAIIGMLMGLLLPAVQQAREAARNIQCSNNCKQYGMAAQSHNATQQFYPSGGWSYPWTGVPSRGFGPNQPGGWLYSVLPFMEQQAVFEATPSTRLATPLGFLNCPSRRVAKLYPRTGSLPYDESGKQFNCSSCVKSDYCACTGTYSPNGNNDYWFPVSLGSTGQAIQSAADTAKNTLTGVIFGGSQIGDADIYDGASNTYLIGEKNVNASHYESGSDGADNEHPYGGHGNENSRGLYTNMSGNLLPAQDRMGITCHLAFGSAHPGAFNMTFADGSVHRIRYSTSKEVNYCLANRADEGKDWDGNFVKLDYE